jgi:AraC-like DNA-binding protein
MTTPLTLLDALLRGTLLALLLLMAAVLRRDRPRSPAALAGVAIALGLTVQVLGAMPWIEEQLAGGPAFAPVIGISVANAVLFWVFVQALFDDEFALRPRHLLAWAVAVLLGMLNCLTAGVHATPLRDLTMAVQRAVPLVFSVLAVLAAARHWRADLVEGRRRLRAFLLVTGVAYTLAMLLVRLATGRGRLSDLASLLDVLALLVMVSVAAWGLLRLGASELFPQAGPMALPQPALPAASDAPVAVAAEGPDPADERLALALQRVMDEERAYRDEGLSVASLAARLGAPEYRLRRLINQRLGHRNFNAFVNGYRLAEARAALVDPRRSELPVLSIALDAGFQSIGPFNRAFKAATGLTPTEFRREKLADS